MNRQQMISKVKRLLRESHPNIRGVKIEGLTSPPKRWHQYSRNNPFRNRWDVKTYPTGLRQKQMYVVVRANGWHPTIYDVTSDHPEKIWMKSMGRLHFDWEARL